MSSRPAQSSVLNISELEALCSSGLTGSSAVWPCDSDEATIECFVKYALFHGIDSQVFEHLHLLAGCPAVLRLCLQGLTSSRTAWELPNKQLMREALDAMAAAGVATLVCKGTALACWLYPNPVWRSRSDTDLLVTESDLAAAIMLLTALGYKHTTAEQEVIFYKLYCTGFSPEGGEHNIDLHWRLNNSGLLSDLFAVTQLHANGMPLPRLSAAAVTVSMVDALLIACMHSDMHKAWQ